MVRTTNMPTAEPACQEKLISNDARQLHAGGPSGADQNEAKKAEESAVAFASITSDSISLGEGPRDTYLQMLAEGYASGADPFYTLLVLKDRMGKDAAAETARSEVMAAYHSMQMAIIGNMKA